MSKPIIACDIDGVLSDLLPGAANYLRKQLDQPPLPAPLYQLMNYAIGVKNWLADEFLRPSIYEVSPPHPGAAQALTALAAEYDIAYITARCNSYPTPAEAMASGIPAATIAWLDWHGFPKGDLHMTNGDGTSKADLALTLYGESLAIAIEDEPGEAYDYADAGVLTFMVRQAHNEWAANTPVGGPEYPLHVVDGVSAIPERLVSLGVLTLAPSR